MDGKQVAGVAVVSTSLACGLLLALMSCGTGGEGRTPIQIAQDNERQRQLQAAVAERKALRAAQAVNQSRTPSRQGKPIPNGGPGQTSPGDHPEGGEAANVMPPPEGG